MNEWSRMWARASFVGVLIVIGLPLWWKTTEVYRVALPYAEIESFDSLSQKIATELVLYAADAATADEITKLIEQAFKHNDIITLKVSKNVLSHERKLQLENENNPLGDFADIFDFSKHNILYVVQNKRLSNDVWLGNERVVVFKDLSAASTLIQVLDKWVYQTEVLRGARSNTPDQARRTRFPPSDRYHIVLSVVHPRPGELKVEFDARQTMDDYIGSFVDELSLLHNFTLKSQWLHFLEFDFKATKVSEGSGVKYAARRGRMHALLTQVEARAALRLAGAAAVSLALYVVPCAHAPLVLYADDEDREISPVAAFASPRWGGVVLVSPPRDACSAPESSWSPDENTLMGIFIAQLRMLLGFVEYPQILRASLEPLRSVSPRRWEVDALLRLRCLEQVTTAERTLQSLAQLLGEIPNIVINDKVGAAITSAVENIQLASELGDGGRLVEAYQASQKAHLSAETAFTEPSLLALLYFPNDQKYAIYIPLFLPVMLPVVLSLKNLFIWFKGKKYTKEKTD